MANGNGELGIRLSFSQWFAIAGVLLVGGVGWGMLKADMDGLKHAVEALTVGQTAAVVQIRDMHDEVISLKGEVEGPRRR